MRRLQGLAATIGGTVLAAAAAAAGFAVLTQAQADDPLPADAQTLALTGETSPDFTSVPVHTASASVAPASSGVAAGTLAGEWAQEVGDWAAPRLRQVEAVAWRYEPKLDLQVRERNGSTEARVTLAFDPERKPEGESRLDRLGLKPVPASDARKGRWFLFAADNKRAVGMNLLRDRRGEMKRSWSTERIAAIGDAQIGVGWRKGSSQTSIGLVDREVSVLGRSRDERFLALTFSYKPAKVKRGGAGFQGRKSLPPPPPRS